MENKITINAQKIQLEGKLHEGHDPKGAIITHPHPLYGGDMDNTIVTTLAHAFQEAGWSTLRFNFRGTGQSQGSYDNGSGEQSDIQAAIDFFRTRSIHQIQLAGYSFGAWVLAGWSQHYNQTGYPFIMVSPPVAFIDFPAGPLPGLKAVLAGQRDDLGPPGQIQSNLKQWCPGAKLTIIEKADHFYSDREKELTKRFSHCIKQDDSFDSNPHPS